jgi:membrane protein implicated in regulation of membrane protease activity
MGAVPRPPYRPATGEIDEQTEVGELYVAALLRAQLRPALVVLSGLVICLGGVPLLFRLAPAMSNVSLGPFPLPWLLLGVLVYPLLLVAAWWHVRAAERVERDFTEILRRR